MGAGPEEKKGRPLRALFAQPSPARLPSSVSPLVPPASSLLECRLVATGGQGGGPVQHCRPPSLALRCLTACTPLVPLLEVLRTTGTWRSGRGGWREAGRQRGRSGGLEVGKMSEVQGRAGTEGRRAGKIWRWEAPTLILGPVQPAPPAPVTLCHCLSQCNSKTTFIAKNLLVL